MKMNIYRLTDEEYEGICTDIKNLVISYLSENELLDKQIANDLIFNYAIIIKKPSFFTRLWKKKNVNQKHQYVLVKQLTIKEEWKDPKLKVMELKPEKDKDE